MQITFEGSPYINIMMINLKKNSKEMTQLLEWSCLSGPQWLLYCVAVPASLYGPVPSWPGGIGADGDVYSKVSVAKQVSLNIKFPVGHWPIWCQDPKKTTLAFFSAATITTRTLSTESSTSTANQSVRWPFWSMKIFVRNFLPGDLSEHCYLRVLHPCNWCKTISCIFAGFSHISSIRGFRK